MAVFLSPIGTQTFFQPGGNSPASGAQLFSYSSGSSSKLATYTTSSGAIANSNPMVLDSGGNLNNGSGEIWLTQGQQYRFLLAPSNDSDPPSSPYWTRDSITGINDNSFAASTTGEWIAFAGTPIFAGTSSFTVAGDHTSIFIPGRRIKTTNSGGTVYSQVLTSVFGSVTTVTVVNDSGNLDSGLSAISYGLLSSVNPSIPPFMATPIAADSTDASKRLSLSLSGITTGATRTITVPDSSGMVFETTNAPQVKAANCTLSASVSSNALTVALKTLAGADPSAGDPLYIVSRSSTASSGALNVRSISSAISVTIPASTTIGTTSAKTYRIWAGAIDNSGTIELALFLSQSLTNMEIRSPYESTVVNTSSVSGGSSAFTWYSTSSRSGVLVTVLGYLETAQTSSGVWASNPSLVVTNPTERPGQTLQKTTFITGAVSTGTALFQQGDNIPNSSTGTQFMSLSLTPRSAASFLRVNSEAQFGASGTIGCAMALFQDSNASSVATAFVDPLAANATVRPSIKHVLSSQTTSSTTFKVRAGPANSGTLTFNGLAGSRQFGGTYNSFIEIEEIST